MRPLLLSLCLLAAALLPLSSPAETGGPRGPLVCDFHSHAAPWKGVGDSGALPPARSLALHAEKGYDLVVWSPHSDFATEDREGMKAFAGLLGTFPLEKGKTRMFLGLELTLERGPNYRRVGGFGNNNHVGIVGLRVPIPHGLSWKAAFELVHACGAVGIVNHPGPGPAEWEEDYWQRADLLPLADGLECYNGRLAAFGRFEEAAYRWAVSHGGRLFCTAGTDYHRDDPLDVATAVYVRPGEDVLDALRAGRTAALAGRPFLVPGKVSPLGGTVVGDKVKLAISFPSKVDRLFLYRGEKVFRRFEDVDGAEAEVPCDGAAWSWWFRKGRARGQCSAVLALPAPPELPDFALSAEEGFLVVSNLGARKGRTVLAVFDAPPFLGGKKISDRRIELGPGGKLRLKLPSAPRYYVLDPAPYGRDEQAPPPDADRRNNALNWGSKWW